MIEHDAMKSTLHLFVHEYSEGSLPHSFDVRNLSCQNHSSKNRHLQLFGNLSLSVWCSFLPATRGLSPDSFGDPREICGESMANSSEIQSDVDMGRPAGEGHLQVGKQHQGNMGRLIFHDSG